MQTCAVCGQESPDVARFCAACGAALAAVPERREERKVVTVLFADLVGFTSRAEDLDPEDVRAVLAPYWERLRTELERFGGTVEKFIGDAVMALFGAPVAHEDDPERAVRAALAIRDWALEEDELQVRIAVNTGEALVLLGARPAEGEGMAAGDVVNTAARLQAAAPVNGVLVAETTYRATRDVVEYAEREPVVAKGKSAPVRVWEAVQARSRLGMDLEQRALMPLVGRVRELDTLHAAFDRARVELEPQLVTVVGVPGIGKSRLVAELFQRLDASPELVWWRQGRALPYGDGVSFWAVGEMVKAQAGVQENDALDVAREKLWTSLEGAVAAEERAWVARHLLPLVGDEQHDAESRSESFAAWRTYLEGLAEQRPLVLVFEDLHWADDGLLDFVDHLADRAAGVPLLLLGTARPELLDRRPGWGGGKLNSTTLALSPLADAEAAQIVARVLEQALLSAETQQVLLDRAGGNPLYAEQFARLYVERGSTDDLPLPETIQGIIAARLDTLASDEKLLLQDAAVLGKVFWSGGAAALSGLGTDVVDVALHSLGRKGLVRRERRSAVSGEEEYAFRHVLVRDVAYGQIPRDARRAKHIAAAEWIDGLGRPDDHAEHVAHHYRAALELARASGMEVREDRARAAFRRAGDRALRLGAFPVAARFYAEALDLWPEDAERPHVLLAHGRARFHAEGEASELLEARDALETVGALDAAAQAGALAAHAAWRGGRRGDAEAILARALTLLEGREASAATAEVLAEQARLHAFAGRTGEAEATASRALELAERLGLEELRASAANTLGVIALVVGDLRRARMLYEDVLSGPARLSERVRALTNLGVVWASDGYTLEAARYGALAAEAALRMGDVTMRLWIEAAEIRESEYGHGRWDEVLRQSALFLETTAGLGGHYLDPGVRLIRACVLAARDHATAAEREVERALSQLDPSADLQNAAPSLNEAAQVYLVLGDRERAAALVDRLLRLVRASSFRAPAVSADGVRVIVGTGRGDEWLELSRAKLAETGRVWPAQLICAGRAADAAEIYEHIAVPHEVAVCRLLAAEQLTEQGRRAEAEEHLHRALAFFRAAGATRIVRQAESLLAAAS